MALRAAVVVPAFFLEDDDFVTLALLVPQCKDGKTLQHEPLVVLFLIKPRLSPLKFHI